MGANPLIWEEIVIKKIIMFIISALIFLSCAQNQNLSEEERDKWRRAKQRYDAGQKGGP